MSIQEDKDMAEEKANVRQRKTKQKTSDELPEPHQKRGASEGETVSVPCVESTGVVREIVKVK